MPQEKNQKNTLNLKDLLRNKYKSLFLSLCFIISSLNFLYSQSKDIHNINVIRNDSIYTFNGDFIYNLSSSKISGIGFFALNSGLIYTVKAIKEGEWNYELYKIFNDSIIRIGEISNYDSIKVLIFNYYGFKYTDYGIINMFDLAIDSSQFVYTTTCDVVYCCTNGIDTIANRRGDKGTFLDCYCSPYLIKKDSSIIYIQQKANNKSSNYLSTVFRYDIKTKKTKKIYQDYNIFQYYQIDKENAVMLKGSNYKKRFKKMIHLKKGKLLIIKDQVERFYFKDTE